MPLRHHKKKHVPRNNRYPRSYLHNFTRKLARFFKKSPHPIHRATHKTPDTISSPPDRTPQPIRRSLDEPPKTVHGPFE